MSLCRALEEAGLGLDNGVGPCLVCIEGLDGGGHGAQAAGEGKSMEIGNEDMKDGRVGFLSVGRDLTPRIK